MKTHFIETNADIRFVIESDDNSTAGITEYDLSSWDGYTDLRAAYRSYCNGELDDNGISAAAREFWDANWGLAINGQEIWDSVTSGEPYNYPHPSLEDELDDTCNIICSFDLGFEFFVDEN